MPLITFKAQIHADSYTEAVLKDAMFCATKVYNGLLWHLREEYKKKWKSGYLSKEPQPHPERISPGEGVLLNVCTAHP